MSETDWMPAYAPWAEVRATISALRKRYRGTRLTDHLDVTLVRDGEEGYIERTHLSSVPVPARPSAEDAEACIRSELSLVWGIGPARESRYRERDTPVTDLGDLLQEDRYSIAAEEILRDLEERRLEPLIDLLRTRLPGRGQLLSTQLVAFADLERTAILDFETLGLFGNVIYLAGIGRFEGGRLVVKQYLAASYDDEPAMLRRVMSELSGVDLLITYNGRTADLPWFASRAAYHRLGAIRQPAHLDLLHACRQRYVRDLAVAEDARLSTLQRRVLGLDVADAPGALMPLLYKEYQRRPNVFEGLLVPILEHNVADIEGVTGLLGNLLSDAGLTATWT